MRREQERGQESARCSAPFVSGKNGFAGTIVPRIHGRTQMNRVLLAYVVVPILAIAMVVAVIVGAAKGDARALSAGLIVGLYVVVISTNVSLGRQVKKETEKLRDEIRDLRESIQAH